MNNCLRVGRRPAVNNCLRLGRRPAVNNCLGNSPRGFAIYEMLSAGTYFLRVDDYETLSTTGGLVGTSMAQAIFLPPAGSTTPRCWDPNPLTDASPPGGS